MRKIRRVVAVSDHPLAGLARRAYRGIQAFSMPAPRVVVVPALYGYLVMRWWWHTFLRVFIAEPLFKAYCHSYGKRLRTGIFVHWISGPGYIDIGNDVEVDGKCSIHFASRYTERPTLEIGDN